MKERVEHEELKKWEEGTKRGTKKESRAREREDGGGRGEAWQAVQRDVPLETENSPAPD